MQKEFLSQFSTAILLALSSCSGSSSTAGDAQDQADMQDTLDAADVMDVAVDPDTVDLVPDIQEDPRQDTILEPLEDPGTDPDAQDLTDAADFMEEEIHSLWEGILCGWGICMEPEICCWRHGYPPIAECMTEEACLACSSCFFPQRCDGPEDCGVGEECCYAGGDFLSEAYCEDNDACDRFCHTEADCGGEELCCGFLTAEHILLNHCYEGTICPP